MPRFKHKTIKTFLMTMPSAAETVPAQTTPGPAKALPEIEVISAPDAHKARKAAELQSPVDDQAADVALATRSSSPISHVYAHKYAEVAT